MLPDILTNFTHPSPNPTPTPTTMPKPNHLIIVCGHAIWLGGPQNGHSESEWLIESYKTGETPTFIAHIKASVELLATDPLAVLAFSGYLSPSQHPFPHPNTIPKRPNPP
jgi:hypothetical protein